MSRSGPKHVLVHDLDGTLTGVGADASVLARAEFMNELREDTSKFTWYNIPTKMLYDPAPYNDPGDPGWDMSAYEAYNNGAQSLSYRRLQEAEVREAELARRTRLWQEREDGTPGSALTSSLPAAAADDGDGAIAIAVGEGGRQLQSATEADWRNRMVFYPGDERAFYQGLDGRVCDPASAIYDPSCRTIRKTHREVAYKGYGTYRTDCTLNTGWNAWVCPRTSLVPARLVVESMDTDHTSRNLAPVALASGGYVDLMNAGWDHQRPKDCGGCTQLGGRTASALPQARGPATL